LTREAAGSPQQALQTIIFDPPARRPLYFSGWSKAEGVTGCPDSDYSLYLDVYTEAGESYGHILEFDTCTDNWQLKEGFVVLHSPIESVNVHCLFRGVHSGTVWFDDVVVDEVPTGSLLFDSVPVTTLVTHEPDATTYSLATGDGLALDLARDGGAVKDVKLGGIPVADPEAAYASGFFVHDVAEVSDFVHVGGDLSQDGEIVIHSSTVPTLGLEFRAVYTPTADRIEIHAEVTNVHYLAEPERALTLYFALPIMATETWTWGEYVRENRGIIGTDEFVSFSGEHVGMGANGHLSEYPWASLTGPDGGLALGIPLDSPRAMCLIHNPVTNQFYAAFDLGLSPQTTKFPNQASVDLIIYHLEDEYRFDADWDFRAAAQGYYERFTDAFTRRIPAEKEGIWVAFSDLEPITDVQDFGIGFHELGDLDQVPFDEENGILSFYYLAEPQTHWLPVNDSAVDPEEYTQIIPYLKGQYGLPNMVLNDRFEEGPLCSADHWENDFSIGSESYSYLLDEDGGRDGGRALKLVNDGSTVTPQGGARQVIWLNQTISHSLVFSGWSRFEGVPGDNERDYSVYLDIHYNEGDPTWGEVLTFSTSITGWQSQQGLFEPDRPISYITVHCLLRGTYSGTAWFDGLNVHQIIQLSDQDPVPLLPNRLTNASFEGSLPGIADFWDDFYVGTDHYSYTVDEDGGWDGGRALELENDGSTATPLGGARQVVTISQTAASPLYLSGRSRFEGIPGDNESDYGVYLDIHYTEGDPTWGEVLTFSTGTSSLQFRDKLLVPDRPISYVSVHCLLRGTYSGTAWFDDLHLQAVGGESEPSEATVSSGLFDHCGRYRYEAFGPDAFAWCRGRVGCALFTVNPDPDISDPDYPLNKAHLEWNEAVTSQIIIPELDGVYVDSFLRDATMVDFRTAHFAATDTPLAYQTSNRRVGTPEVFATTEFARWVAEQVHEKLDRWMMANWILRELPWGADLFDVMGTEIHWLKNSAFEAERDSILSYRRTLSYQRPYLLLLNANFDYLTPALVERYFQIALFYGFYPSMFSHNAAEDPYWENPALYNRDRPLFARYIPIIRRLNRAGWEPVTYAYTSEPDKVYVERFGRWPDLYFTLRNPTTLTTNVTVTLQSDGLELPAGSLYAWALLGGAAHPVALSDGFQTFTMTLGAETSEAVYLNRPVYLPIILTEDW
jgi:hypothetical protein